jgi:hypothetical protein
MATVHPAWLNRHLLLSRVPWLSRGCGLKLLNNDDDRLLVDSTAANTDKSKAVERA